MLRYIDKNTSYTDHFRAVLHLCLEIGWNELSLYLPKPSAILFFSKVMLV